MKQQINYGYYICGVNINGYFKQINLKTTWSSAYRKMLDIVSLKVMVNVRTLHYGVSISITMSCCILHKLWIIYVFYAYLFYAFLRHFAASLLMWSDWKVWSALLCHPSYTAVFNIYLRNILEYQYSFLWKH